MYRTEFYARAYPLMKSVSFIVACFWVLDVSAFVGVAPSRVGVQSSTCANLCMTAGKGPTPEELRARAAALREELKELEAKTSETRRSKETSIESPKVGADVVLHLTESPRTFLTRTSTSSMTDANSLFP